MEKKMETIGNIGLYTFESPGPESQLKAGA